MAVIGITTGDPLGIGPEVAVKALADGARRSRASFVIYGAEAPLCEAARAAGIAPFWRAPGVALIEYRASATPSAAEAGELSFRFVEDAIADTRRAAHGAGGAPGRPVIDAIVTAPISKAHWALAGHGEFPGHTELLAARFGVTRVRMMFIAPRLRVMLATTHVPLMKVGAAISAERVLETIVMADEACRRLGVARPRVAVCGLNPHAGEGGLLGDEDQRVIAPAVESAKRQGIAASGPWPGDTVFTAAVSGAHDIVVAMYHDQGLIPVKLLAFHSAVNATIGLPVVRTSPDHGTAFDIAGRNLADPGSMGAAIDLAIELAARAA